jgi:hypothetical protein
MKPAIFIIFFLSISYPQSSFDNSIELNLKNDSYFDADSLVIEITEIPLWCIFENTLIKVDKISKRSSKSVNFKFNISEDVPERYDHKFIVIVRSKNKFSSKEIRISNSLINTFDLFQNYPNPFNPSTVIRYQIPVNVFVTLKVYDVLGSKVATLVNEEKTAGSYEVIFDASGLSSGVYYYTLSTGNFVQTNKMLLLK